MKILVLNANTTESVTQALVERLQSACPPNVQLIGATATFGAPYVASRAAVTVAGHAALEAVRASVAREADAGRPPFDACHYACFGEPGIEALREEMAVPVVGMAEATILCALQLGERFSILTVGEAWPPMLRELMRRTALQERCAGLGVVPGDALALAGDRAEGARVIRAAAQTVMATQKPDVLIVGGAALAGYAGDLTQACGVPVLDSLFASFEQA
ncbi:MAG: hypothetical protein B7Z15_06240, partial [Rhizobiales bacterium 32-66-8]